MRTRSAPAIAATPACTLAHSASGIPGGAAMTPLLRGELLNLHGVVPGRREHALSLVVPSQPADLRLDEVEASEVRQVPGVQLQVRLEVHGLPHQVPEVLRHRELRPSGAHDLRDDLAGRDPHVRHDVLVPANGADLRGALPLRRESGDRLLDLVRLYQ